MIGKVFENEKVFIFVGLILIIATGFYFVTFDKEDDYFNTIELSNNNLVVNNSLPKYIYTILSVGLDQAGLVGTTIVVNQMSSNAENLIPDYELKAHIREWGGTFYLFLGDFNRNESIKILSHEIIHIHQYYSEELKYFNGKVYWKGDEFDLNSLDYDKRPWEEDAFDREKPLSNAIQSILVN